ncbi:MAG: hypothetical protein FJ098_15745 [Deltaproteobacteria bacterium]|nr:hypothetical protein [Deltaproteobacteria bacterium]
MGIITGLVLVLLGILGASSVIIRKQPEAKDFIERLAKYQGYIGIVACIWGLWTVLHAILNLGWLRHAGVWWLTYMATGVLQVSLGFILGYGLIRLYALDKANDATKAKAEQTYQKLVSLQIPMGFAAIILGIWCILARFVYPV